MTNPDISNTNEVLAEISKRLVETQQETRQLVEKLEIQGAIQLEMVKLLQSFSEQHSSVIGTLLSVQEKVDELSTPTSQSNPGSILRVEGHLSQIYTNLHSMKQVMNLTLRETTSRSRTIRCVFIVQSIPMWDAHADIYWSMVDDPRFHPMVVSINHSQLGRAEFSGEDDVHRGLLEQNIPHLRLNVQPIEALDILRSLMPDVIFRQQQWDTPLPPTLRTPEITFARLCVIPYGMGVLANPNAANEDDEAYANNYDQLYHRMAWRVFCETEITQRYYRSFEHSDPDKFVLTGYPKHDRLLQAKGKGQWPIAEPDGRRFRVIWAPHHSLAVHGAGFGVFHKIYRDMLQWAASAPEIQFVLKPHPALSYTADHSGVLRNPDYSTFLARWADLPNCAVCEGQYGELFDASDMLLTDGVSFLTEYHLFSKPIIFFDSGVHARFNELGRLAEKAAHRVQSFEEMRNATLAYKNGKTWELEKERQDLLTVLLPHSQSASSIILDTIADGIYSSGVTHV